MIIHTCEHGLIRKDDWQKIVGAINIIGTGFFTAPHEGITHGEWDYLPLDLIEDPENIVDALIILMDYMVNCKENKEAAK